MVLIFMVHRIMVLTCTALHQERMKLFMRDNRQIASCCPTGKAPELLAATTKKRRKRKGKLPKNFDPKVDPDPERWLARKDRSTYKGRRRDKRKDAGIGKGTQGGVGNTEGLDASKPAPGEGKRNVFVLSNGLTITITITIVAVFCITSI